MANFDPGKAFEGGSAGVGKFGSLLAGVSPIALGVTAAIAGIGLVMQNVWGTMEFAAKLQDQAAAAHVTTTALQQYQYALRIAGGEEEKAASGLESFNTNLGKAQAGLKGAQRGFKELGFTSDQIKGFKDADTALKAVTDRIGNLGSNAQKDAVISQLGLNDLKPLIMAGTQEMQRLKAEAISVGVVMDEHLVRRAADLQEEVETVSKVIDIQLKSAFIDAAPALLELLKMVASMARLASEIADDFRDIGDRSEGGLVRQRNAALKEIDRLSKEGGPAAQELIKAHSETVQRISAELAGRAHDAKPPADTGGTNLIPQTKTPKSTGPTPEQVAANSERLIEQAKRAELQAQLAITHDTLKRHDIIEEQIEAERRSANAAVDKQLATKQITEAAAIEAKAANDRAAISKQAANEERFLLDNLAEAVSQQQAIAGYLDAQADIQLRLARTTRERYDIERQILKDRQAFQRRMLEDEIVRQHIDPASANQRRTELGKVQQGERDALQDQYTQIYKNGLLDAFRAAQPGAEGLANYFGNRLKERLLDGLAEMAAKWLMSIGRNPDGSSQSGLMGFLSKGIDFLFGGGRASGGPVWPGKAYDVGEFGKERFVPTQPGVILNNGLMNAIGAGAGSSKSVVHQYFTLNNQGILATEVFEEIKAMGARATIQGGALGAAHADRRMSQMQRRRQQSFVGPR